MCFPTPVMGVDPRKGLPWISEWGTEAGAGTDLQEAAGIGRSGGLILCVSLFIVRK